MAATGMLKALYLRRFSKPASDRALYRMIKRKRPQRMLLLGLGDGRRAVKMVELAQRYAATDDMLIAGVDMFEGRPADAPTELSLKEAHRSLRDTGTQVQLVPGDPFSALARAANGLPNIDLMLVDADQDADAVARAWFYAPRMLSDTSLVLVEQVIGSDDKSGQPITKFDQLDLAQVEQMATASQGRRAA
ncbi:MAG: hypothetical protein MI757_13455 [Pirellulales bacterium]|nr:hypothetical protein [Pirellulales bacterium]